MDRGKGNWGVDDQERAFGDRVPAKRALSPPEAPEGQYESGKQGEKRREAPLETSWGADFEELPKDDPEIGGRDMNLEALGHVPLSPDEDPTESLGGTSTVEALEIRKAIECGKEPDRKLVRSV